MLLPIVCSEPRQKVPSFKLKIPSPSKKPHDSVAKEPSRRTLIESRGDGTFKSSVGNTVKTLADKPIEPHLNFHVEWALIYTEEEGDLLLIFAKSEGEDKLQVGKTFTYGQIKNVEYEDNDSPNLLFDVQSSRGMRKVRVDEGYFVTDSCHPKALKKDVQTKNNLIVALRPYIKGELMVTQASTPPKSGEKKNQNTRSRRKGNNLRRMILKYSSSSKMRRKIHNSK